jgi:site-specific recombinase XerD
MAVKISKATIEQVHPKAKPYEIRGRHGLILRVQPSGKKTFYCQTGRGKRQRIGDAEVITLWRAEYCSRELLNEAHDFGNAIKRDPVKSTLGGFIEAHYAPWVRANRRRGDKCISDLKRCFESIYGKRLTDITKSDLDRYVASRRDAGRSLATVVRDMNNLRSVLRRAIDANYLRDNPFKGWEKPEVEDAGVTRYLNEKEEARLRSVLRRRDDEARRERARGNKWRVKRGYELLPEIPKTRFSDHLAPMVLVSINTGLRYGELAGLESSAVDFRVKVLTVTGRTSKGAKTRHVPLNTEVLDVLTRWRGEGAGKGLVFANPDGSRIGSVKTAWFAVLADAGINDFRWHDLRHTFASKLVQRGVDLVVVRDLLGHGEFALTLRYAHLEPTQKTEAVARLAA